MATFGDFETQWKQAAGDFASKKFSDFKNQAVADANSFFIDAKTDLIKWTALLMSRQIDEDEFETLVGSDEVLLEMHTLKQAGLAQARWDSFVSGILYLTVSTAIKVFV